MRMNLSESGAGMAAYEAHSEQRDIIKSKVNFRYIKPFISHAIAQENLSFGESSSSE